MEFDRAQVTGSYGPLLRNRNYRLLWLGQLVSVFGERLHQIALLVLVGSLTGGHLGSIGLLFVTIGLPELLFGPFAGALADRWDRRRVMIAADLSRFVVVLSVPYLAGVDLAFVYVLTFVLTTASIFFRPAKDAILPSIVPRDRLMAANAFSESTDTAMDVLGYPVAGALVGGLSALLPGGVGIALAFYVDAATYAFSALMLWRMSVRTESGEKGAGDPISGLLGEVRAGLDHLRSNSVVLTNTLIVFVEALLSLGTWTLTWGYATEVTETGAFGFSMLEAGLGLGSLAGGLAVGKWGGRFPRGPMLLCGILLTGASMASLAFFANLWLAVVLLAIGGVGNMVYLVSSVTLVQERTPEAFLGRIFSLRGMLISLALVTSNAVVGPAAEYLGVRPMWGLTGGLIVLVGLLSFLLPSARDVR